jgi:seryl-tRNA synthetase
MKNDGNVHGEEIDKQMEKEEEETIYVYKDGKLIKGKFVELETQTESVQKKQKKLLLG